MQSRPKRRRIAPSVLVVSAVFACGEGAGSPERVAASFWSAVTRADWPAAQALSTARDPSSLELLSKTAAAVEVSSEQTLENDQLALVATTLRLDEQAAETEPLRFNTHLVRFDDAWRVDVAATGRELGRIRLGRAADELESALRDAGVRLGEALEQGAREASSALREALDELERSLEEPPEAPQR